MSELITGMAEHGAFTQDYGDGPLSVTTDASAVPAHLQSAQPVRIGRYRVTSVLGRGGFGVVYLGYDEQLDRPVAIKVPHRTLVSHLDEAEAYLAEARAVASLDHPHIVPVYDVGSTQEFPCFIVSKYVDGQTLYERMEQGRLDWREASELVIRIAEALHYAHTRGLVHRDVKPRNILLDRSGHCYVVDFGLALREADVGTGPRYAGTPAYMSPEQARGEGHRVDGRSDVYSLGTMFYELLAGRRTFAKESTSQLLQQIIDDDVRPLRQIDDRIPKELENICLKALAKRASDRYTTAMDMAQEIRLALEQTRSFGTRGAGIVGAAEKGVDAQPVAVREVRAGESASFISQIVPKGLRSFDEHDADFFLSLLPGPRDRLGLPDSIRFWKTRIEADEADHGFVVGLIYGPSGAGKSSFVKAGLLPQLSDRITTVYVEATANDTEVRMLHALRRSMDGLPEAADLTQALAAIRQQTPMVKGKRVLLVVDQFEQWLNGNREWGNAKLVEALRQCDGERLQCVILVRDDFWMAVTEFFADLEIDLVPNQNVRACAPFGTRHGRRVLAAFGRAYGALPRDAHLSDEQKRFLEEAVDGLAEDGKVVCVRLALFAEMMKDKSWVPATLDDVGGTQGIGVMFLDETFSSATACPEHRFHQNGARAVLQSLLPETGVSIRGKMCSHEQLRAASGYGRGRDFDRLMHILDTELRLVTPTDPDGTECAPPATSSIGGSGRFYQLTHDYLVPSLQQWLKRKQKETHRGRAELCLAERTSAWSVRRENRDLPSWWEFMAICLHTRRYDWTDPQREMMHAAGRFFLVRTAACVLLLVGVGWALRESHARTRVAGLIDTLTAAETAEVPQILEELESYRPWVATFLSGPEAGSLRSEKAALHLELARLRFPTHEQSDPAKLQQTLLSSPPEVADVVAGEMAEAGGQSVDSLWSVIDESAAPAEILSAASVLAKLDPDDARWEQHAELVDECLLSVNSSQAPRWVENLAPIRDRLIGSLTAFFEKPLDEHSEAAESDYLIRQRHNAAIALAAYLQDDPEEICRLLVGSAADADEFQNLIGPLSAAPQRSAELLKAELARVESLLGGNTDPENPKGDVSHQISGTAVANGIIALLVLGGDPPFVRSHLAGGEDPTLRTQLMHRIAELGVSIDLVVEMLAVERQSEVRAALLLALGEYRPASSSPKLLETIRLQLQNSLTASNAGEHAAACWLAKHWGLPNSASENPPMKQGDRTWTFGPNGHRLVSIRSLPEEHFEIGDREVSIDQYVRFNSHYVPAYEAGLRAYMLSDVPGDCPVVYVSAYDAMKYCNWLSAEDGLGDDQLCYRDNGDGTFAPMPGYLSQKGYRLPTHEEWLAACRAGAATSFSFGDDLDMLGHFAWYYSNSRHEGQNRAHRVGELKPNALGLFDMYGNVWEWTTDFGAERWSILCGGSCDNDPADLMATKQLNPKAPELREHRVGFRIARTVRE